MEIKEEIENEIKREGFLEVSGNQTTDSSIQEATVNNNNSNNKQTEQLSLENQTHINQHSTQQSSLPQQVPLTENNTNVDQMPVHSSNPNSLLIQNRLITNHNSNCVTTGTADGIVNFTNHINSNAMQPPRTIMITPSPRKRNRTNSISSVTPIPSEALETMYLEEVRKKNVLLVEQGEINRKRLRLEERKVKLMEEFFPKFMNLQEDILKKLEAVRNETPSAINIKLEE